MNSASVIEAGSYEEFKLCALEHVKLPVIGCDYRLLNDDFAGVWRLMSVEVVADILDRAVEIRIYRFLTPAARNDAWNSGVQIACTGADGWYEMVRTISFS